jgi:AcrR family transcriptional regulator
VTDLGAPGRDAPRTKGERTRRRLLEAAEQVFADHGYHDASIVKITEAAGVAQGTFYLYFSGKQAIFDVLVEDLNRRLRHAMADASAKGGNRMEVERLGFDAFFRFTSEHPALYRVIRQAEFVSPKMLHLHYERLAEGYIEGLRTASESGEIAPADPVVTAWALMGVGEMIGMRWILWGDTDEVPPNVFEETMAFVARALGLPAPVSTALEPTAPSRASDQGPGGDGRAPAPGGDGAARPRSRTRTGVARAGGTTTSPAPSRAARRRGETRD